MRVTAEDLAFPAKSSTVLVTVNVIRNSQTPTFINTGSYDVTISEDKPVLESIVNVTARDDDEGVNGIIKYSISTTQAGANIFGINSNTGVIFARVSLLETSADIYRVILCLLLLSFLAHIYL